MDFDEDLKKLVTLDNKVIAKVRVEEEVQVGPRGRLERLAPVHPGRGELRGNHPEQRRGRGPR